MTEKEALQIAKKLPEIKNHKNLFIDEFENGFNIGCKNMNKKNNIKSCAEALVFIEKE